MSEITATSAAVELKNISKKFGNCISNSNVGFAVERGTIHGLIGENGAGKSTAMKILFGLYQPDQGEILLNGKRVKIKNPVEAMKLGIGMVHQHFMLAGPESVLDNIILGAEPSWFGWVQRKKAIQELDEISKRYGLGFSKWTAKISELSVGEQQRVEILKLLYQKSNVLILDEPTAVLTPQEVKELFVNLQRLKSEGKTIILISHKLKEVLAYCDAVTVMRRTEVVGTRSIKEATEDLLAEMMVGRKVSFTYQGERKIQNTATPTKPILKIRNLTIPHSAKVNEPLADISFELRPGEVLGIGGVQGNGQSEILRYLSHPRTYLKTATGEYEVHGKDVSDYSPLHLRAHGIGLVPEDRHQEGLLLNQDMNENFLLGQHRDPRYLYAKGNFGGWINRDSVRKSVNDKIKSFDIRPTYSTIWTGKMSGGNQQKLLIARALDPTPSILFVAHPTRGVDVGAIERIHHVIMQERNAGKAVILFSSELDELIDLSDRLLIFFSGKIRGEFERRDFDPWAIGKVMGGA